MTPKEKAYELCYKFMICNSYQAIVWHNARICSLIAVNGFINCDTNIMSKSNARKHVYYWQEVKTEIEKL